MFEERDLALPSVIGNVSLIEENADAGMERLRRTIDLCVELAVGTEVPTLNTGTGGKTGDLEDEAICRRVVDRLGELAEYAAARGVVVCIEPHVNASIDSVERSEWLVRAVNHPALKLDFDVSHFEVQGLPMEDTVRRLAPLAGAAEVKDQHCRVVGSADSGWYVSGNGGGRAIGPDGRELEFQFLLAGEGTFDLARYLQLMQAQGFDKPIAFEASVQCQQRPDYDAMGAAAGIYRWMMDAWKRAGVSME
jgi:inosose dehydratase